MKNLDPHLRAVFSIIAFFLALVFVEAAAYVANMRLGDFCYLLGVSSLTLIAIFYGTRWEGMAFPAMVSMCTTFGLISVFTGMTWMIRRVVYDLPVKFIDSDVRNAIILFVILPLVIASIVMPSVIRKMKRLPSSDAVF